MQELRVPLGIDTSGTLVRAAEADRLTPYACPSCQAVLVLRAGTKRIKHFSHSPNGVCSPESILHKTAKLLIANVISANAAGTPAGEIVLDRACDSCRAAYPRTLPLKTFTAAAQEVRVGKFICDVVGYREKGVHALSIEIMHTHSVNGEKLEALQGYWIELDAEAVIQNPQRWQVIQSKLKPLKCERCRSLPKKPLVQMTSESSLKKFMEVLNRNPTPQAKIRDPYAEVYQQRVRELAQRLNARRRRRL